MGMYYLIKKLFLRSIRRFRQQWSLVMCCWLTPKKLWVIIRVGPVGWPSLDMSKILMFRFCCRWHIKCDKYQTLRDGTTYWASPVHATFKDLNHISKLQEGQTVSTENFIFLTRVETSMVIYCQLYYYYTIYLILTPIQLRWLTCFLMWQNL